MRKKKTKLMEPALLSQAMALIHIPTTDYTRKVQNTLDEIKNAGIISIDESKLRIIINNYYLLSVESKEKLFPNCPRPDIDKEIKRIASDVESLGEKKAMEEKDRYTIYDILYKTQEENPQKLAWDIIDGLARRCVGRSRDYDVDYLVIALVLLILLSREKMDLPNAERALMLPFYELSVIEIKKIKQHKKIRIPWQDIGNIIGIIEPDKLFNFTALKERYRRRMQSIAFKK